jgi:putative membrane protein insertion efficiency factor
LIRLLSRGIAGLLIGLVWVYRITVRPLLPPTCRFTPSCSEYMIQALRKYGPIRGAAKGIGRVCRCHPWNEGGFDPP